MALIGIATPRGDADLCGHPIRRGTLAGGGGAARLRRDGQDSRHQADWLADPDRCTGRIGVIGFCMGGGYALALARAAASLRRVATMAVAHGRRAAAGRAYPIVASYGGKDRSPLGYRAAGRLERALVANGVEHDIKVYPEASHGFLNDHPPEDMTPLTVMLSRLSGPATTSRRPRTPAAASSPSSTGT